LNASQQSLAQGEIEDQVISLPVRPAGIYAFLSGLTPTEDEENEIRKKLPFDQIELKQWGQPNLATLTPGTEYEIIFYADGRAQYLGNSGVQKIGLHSGEISLQDFGRLCLLLDRLSVGKQGCNLGVQVQVSHPVVADLRVSLTGNQKLIEYRNDTAFGDYRFWLVQSAIERIANEIEWQEPKRK
jgi:hypothetical protein